MMMTIMKKIIFFSILVILTVAGILGIFFKNQRPTPSSQKIQIITTLFAFYDFAKNIGLNQAEVTLLLPPGVEAHTFEPKPSDIVKINESDIFIYAGDAMEPWAFDIIKGLSSSKTQIIDSSNNIILSNSTPQGGVDPHFWLNFANDQTIVDNILEALITKDPTNAAFYQINADKYKAKLSKLDQDYQLKLSSCKSREIIYGGHAAFNYLSSRYNLSSQSAYGISPNSESSAQDLAKLIEQIKKDNIKYIFYEELLSPKVAETLAQETNTKLLLLNPAHNLTKEEFDQNVSYIKVMQNNLNNLIIGLNCQ
ncbi:MAG: hypothetical protein ACD_83C00012G0002 [uncultured bacterium]|uniref:Periplasmic solute binding protein n=1 Tax=Berkelbacteria bacterium GW2011_GWA2_38_9 TaxID=1618334 RepID=A0A0G0PGB2_9BACT|nr:MAG: hypothetical protein ACD_83C00012G0002 [uncultured bacterium]KKQ88331.1 MAG: Periplasmic solute binding protein [Berkelbacteria bacterium GW2011_GWA2_38_9]